MNNKKAAWKPRSRSGSAASNSEPELSLGSSTPRQPKSDSMSDHNITSTTSRKSKHQQSQRIRSPDRLQQTERGAIGDGEYKHQLDRQNGAGSFAEDSTSASEAAEGSDVSASSSGLQPDFSDPVYRKLSRLNGEINRMRKEDLRRKLAEYHLHTGGVKEVLKKRLKNFLKRKKLKAANLKSGIESTQFDYLIIIDYEATCQDNNEHFTHEIIEFPAVLVNVQKKEIVGMFREFCRPTINPVLSDFCKQLTGVNQSEVDNASEFPLVLECFEKWLEDRELGTSHSFAVVTDGPWDIQRFLSKQCEISGLPLPAWGRRWINLRKAYCNFYACKRLNLHNMLLSLGLEFEGRPHCGLDDSKNIARIVCHLLHDGCVLKPNQTYEGGRSNLPKPQPPASSRCMDTGDGMHSGDLKPLHAKLPFSAPAAPVTPPPSGSGRNKSRLPSVCGRKDKTLARPDSDEDISDLLYYFQIQST